MFWLEQLVLPFIKKGKIRRVAGLGVVGKIGGKWEKPGLQFAKRNTY